MNNLINLRSILYSTITLCCLSACSKAPSTNEIASAAPTKSADEFIASVNKTYLDNYYEYNAAQWVYVTYLNDDSAMLATKANEKWMAMEKEMLSEARQYKDTPMSAATKKAYTNMTQGKTLLPPDTPEARAELARIGTHMEGVYGAGKYCKPDKGTENCRDLNQLSEVLAKSRDYNELVEAWTGWHSIARAYRSDYQRYVEIDLVPISASSQSVPTLPLKADWLLQFHSAIFPS